MFRLSQPWRITNPINHTAGFNLGLLMRQLIGVGTVACKGWQEWQLEKGPLPW
jgi:hypothetical protein